MKTENKIFIKSFLISGLLYALLMAGLNYFDGESFRIFKFLFKFLFHFFFFGLFMGLLARYSYRKQLKKEINETKIKNNNYATKQRE
jgi:L-asparagine transporter-like permease